MKIQNINIYSQPNFESRRLYKAKLYWYSPNNNEIVPEDVFVSEINKDDILNLNRSEQDKINKKYGTDILAGLLALPKGKYCEDRKYFAIEAPKADGIKIRAMAMATEHEEYEDEKATVYVDFLQSYNQEKDWKIHGAGSCLIYGIIDAFARKRPIKALSLDADKEARTFYEKIGFIETKPKESNYRIKKERFKKIKPVIREKYSIVKIRNDRSL